MKNEILCLLDAGHGVNTLGKRSPDGRLLEYKWAREMASRVSRELSLRGVDARLIVTEDTDVSLRERCRRVNAWCDKRGAANVVLVSIHCNAAGADGKWHDARGFSVFVSNNASAKSKALAKDICDRAIAAKVMGNRAVPPCHYWTQNLAMCRDTRCPAVLVENLFQDNRADVDFLVSAAGKAVLASVMVNGIIDYIEGLRP